MDEIGDLTEEELELAAEFAELLESSDEDAESIALRSLKDAAVLLQQSERWELNSSSQRRGREEVEKWAATPPPSKQTHVTRSRWVWWLPLPALAMLVGVIQISPKAKMGEPAVPQVRAPATDGEDGFERVEPRFHAGEISPALLSAQAAVLSQRTPGAAREEARRTYEREMRAYRGELIASLEVGGR